jgi:hypothetical protein
LFNLSIASEDIVVSIALTVGNNAYEMRVGGKNVFWFPYDQSASSLASPSSAVTRSWPHGQTV